MRFQAEFDRAGVSLSIAAILVLLYFGLTVPQFVMNFWVAFAFWLVGFFGSMFSGITRRTALLTFDKLFSIVVMTGLMLVVFAGINLAYGTLQAGEIRIADKLFSFALGVSEELFFGVFLLGVFINWMGFHPIFAVLCSGGAHAAYHIPEWGANPALMMLFVSCFTVLRGFYVFMFPKVGMLLGAHGFWNFGVS